MDWHVRLQRVLSDAELKRIKTIFSKRVKVVSEVNCGWFVVRFNLISFRACLDEGGGPRIGEVTYGGSPHLSCKGDKIKIRDYIDRWVTPTKRVTSPTWGPPTPCNQAPRFHWQWRLVMVDLKCSDEISFISQRVKP